ncbi:MAG: MBL fold metallo-hydrolase [Myxococcales bacterium]|nr:MBL fold metallo-hydrolase [Myxococcales bacterium]
MSLSIETFPVGAFQCNCSILACEETKEAVVIDPGDELAKILARLDKRGLKVVQIIHTHAHLDHIGATGSLKHARGGSILLHKDDMYLYDAQAMQAQMLGLAEPEHPTQPDDYLEHDDPVRWGRGGLLTTLHTPGHTPGSLCFHLDGGDRQLVFTGDTLFLGSIGRTDLPGGDYGQIMASIRDRLLDLGDETMVIPGHGPGSTIGKEKGWNPFVQELMA